MDVVKSMKVFAEVARQGGFASAARTLNSSTSSVSRQVIELERWLGVALFKRTTRALSLTEEGAYYLSECQKVVDDVARIQDMANEALTQPTGTLRVTASVFLAKECIQRLLPGFLQAFPDITVELSALDRFVDLVDEGFDLAVRVGYLPDSSLVARRLGDVRLVVAASPDYCRERGTPKSPADLKDHNCIVDTVASFNNRWPMTRHGRRQNVSVGGNVTVNNGEIARDLAVQGIGLVLLPQFFVLDQIKHGQLVEVLEGQVDSNVGMYVVYPQSRHLAPKVRAFVDCLVEYFEQLERRNN
ncbi:MAG: LysR family transcriptional regulator [Pseudomonadota bacterium]